MGTRVSWHRPSELRSCNQYGCQPLGHVFFIGVPQRQQ
jgi:hypothetical protein